MSRDDSDADDHHAKLNSIELWMLESALGLNRPAVLKAGRPQRLYQILRRIRALQRALGQHRRALRAWSAEIRDVLRLSAPPDVDPNAVDAFQDLISVVCSILGGFQPEDEPRIESLDRVQKRWLQHTHDLLKAAENRIETHPPQTLMIDTDSSTCSEDDNDGRSTLTASIKDDHDAADPVPCIPIVDDTPTHFVAIDDERLSATLAPYVPLDEQIREQIPRLRHVDPKPEYNPQVALGQIVPNPPPGALLVHIRAQKARLRSVPTRTSSVQVGRVVADRSQSATRYGTPTPTGTPYASEGEMTSKMLVPRAVTMPRSRRLGRRGQFELMGMIKQRQIRSPSVRIPGS